MEKAHLETRNRRLQVLVDLALNSPQLDPDTLDIDGAITVSLWRATSATCFIWEIL